MKKFKSKFKNKNFNLLHAGSISEYNTCADSIYKLFKFCEIFPKCKIFAAEPKGFDDMKRSLAAKKILITNLNTHHNYFFLKIVLKLFEINLLSKESLENF